MDPLPCCYCCSRSSSSTTLTLLMIVKTTISSIDHAFCSPLAFLKLIPIFRGVYFYLFCDNHHGILLKFDPYLEKFWLFKSQKTINSEKSLNKSNFYDWKFRKNFEWITEKFQFLVEIYTPVISKHCIIKIIIIQFLATKLEVRNSIF